MRIACTGIAPGRIASKLIERGVEFISSDITKYETFRKDVEYVNPDVIIHTAALTSVDYCEKNPKEAFDINVAGVNNLTSWFKGRVIYLSSDHIFSGKKWFNFGYNERHSADPVNTYGLTKYSGETIALSGISRVVIVRTSKVFDERDLEYSLSYLEDGKPVEFTGLIKRSFLSANNFVSGLLYVVENFNRMPVILNVSGKSIYSYADFWRGVCRVKGLDESLIIERKSKLKNATPRPFRGGLNVGLAEKYGVPLFEAFDGMEHD